LSGLKIVEFAGIGPTPFCAMMLADMGADIVRLDRIEPADLGMKRDPRLSFTNRGRRSVAIDLKAPRAVEVALRLIDQADAVIEGFRPGVMERLGLGPDVCLASNPRLVYGRMTGWGQDGPLAQVVGHDINFLALTGALHSIGRKDQPPSPPLNLVADLAGGGAYLAFGILCAVLEARHSGVGQVVDGAIVDGVASLLTGVYGARAAGQWSDERGTNYMDGGAPWYDSYETADGKFVAIGPVEGRFYAELLSALGLAADTLPSQHDKAGWPELRRQFSKAFLRKARDEWVAVLKGRDVCVAPVLDLGEALQDPHMQARGSYVEIDGLLQPGPAPRFSKSAPEIPSRPPIPGEHTDAALADWGFSSTEIVALRADNTIN